MKAKATIQREIRRLRKLVRDPGIVGREARNAIYDLQWVLGELHTRPSTDIPPPGWEEPVKPSRRP